MIRIAVIRQAGTCLFGEARMLALRNTSRPAAPEIPTLLASMGAVMLAATLLPLSLRLVTDRE